MPHKLALELGYVLVDIDQARALTRTQANRLPNDLIEVVMETIIAITLKLQVVMTVILIVAVGNHRTYLSLGEASALNFRGQN